MRPLGWALTRLAYKKRRFGHRETPGMNAHRGKTVRGHSEKALCKLTREGSAELIPAKHIDLGLLASKTARKKIFFC